MADPVATNQRRRVALAHDWLTNVAGGERVLLAIHEIYPEAPIYTSVYNRQALPEVFQNMTIKTTWLQHLPLFKYKHQLVAPLRAKAFEKFKFDDFDLVISDSSSDAKGIKVDPQKTLHINYCHTPTRYYWSHYEDYKKEPGFGKMNWLIRPIITPSVKIMRRWDYKAAQRVGVFIANSQSVAHRIKQYYNRDSYVVFPPVEMDRFKIGGEDRDGLLLAGRQVAYKRFDLAVEAANNLQLPLLVIGNGPEHNRLRKIAGPTVTFKEAVDAEMAEAYASAKLLLFPGEEDAGIVPLEAMASGTPVVAYAKGGALESVGDGESGVYFHSQTVDSLCDAIKTALILPWDRQKIRAQAEQFSRQNFEKKLKAIIDKEYADFKSQKTETQ